MKVQIWTLFLAASALGQTVTGGSFSGGQLSGYIPNTPPAIVSFSATPNSLTTGNSATLAWVVSDATTITILNLTASTTLCNPCTNPASSISTGSLSTTSTFRIT